MAQAGIHALVGVAVRKWAPKWTGLVLGIVLGSLIPDADNFVVAVATLLKKSTEGIHRTATHSIVIIVLFTAVFYIVGKLLKKPTWSTIGLGLGVGMLLHVLVDLFLWFDGVAILWPFAFDLNLWANISPPSGWEKLMNPLELGFLALYFLTLDRLARREKTDSKYLGVLRIWTLVETVLFVVFLVLVYSMSNGFATIFGAVYLLSLALAIGVTIRMRKTIETPMEVVGNQRAAPLADS